MAGTAVRSFSSMPRYFHTRSSAMTVSNSLRSITWRVIDSVRSSSKAMLCSCQAASRNSAGRTLSTVMRMGPPPPERRAPARAQLQYRVPAHATVRLQVSLATKLAHHDASMRHDLQLVEPLDRRRLIRIGSGGVQKGLCHLDGYVRGEPFEAERQHVGIVPPPCPRGDPRLPRERRPYPRHLV